jgi:UDP-N-acetylmuramoyl-tripeptide--D-alanyl-D-alanine ligase
MEEIIAAVRGRAQGSPPRAATGVSIDTRTLAPGDLFFAIKGERSDGHGHVVEALEKGAAAAIVKRDYFGAAGPLIRVPDTLEALNALARAARARFHGRAVAVTGSAGKTGVKEMLRLALGASGEAHASDKSYNNLWGVPLSLSRLPEAASFGVFEIGMNHAGEITPLTRLVRPHVAIVTTIAPVHLEFFSGIEGIAEAKAEIFLGLEAGGVAVINRDVPQFDLLARRAREAGAAEIVSFGEHEAAEARLIEARLEPERSFVVARILGEQVEYEIGAPGRHIVMNSLSALAAAARAGASLAKAAAALGAFTPPEGRGVRAAFDAPGGRSLVIDESYNANPASVRAALAVLGHIPRADHPRRVVVLGDMLELGHAARQMHADLNAAIDEQGIDVVFACGELMQALYDALPAERRGAYALTADDLRGHLIAGVRPGDAIMVKGSLGSRMGPLAAALKDHFRRLAGGDASG